jgi:hypothetical protein
MGLVGPLIATALTLARRTQEFRSDVIAVVATG